MYYYSGSWIYMRDFFLFIFWIICLILQVTSPLLYPAIIYLHHNLQPTVY